MAQVESISRRSFLAGAMGKSSASMRDPAPTPSLAAHVANRLMYGPKPGDVAAIEAQGVDAWIQEQLNPDSSESPEFTSAAGQLPLETLFESTTQLWDRREYSDSIRPANQVRHLTLTRMLHSKWQLKEVIVEFWRDHFNVYAYDDPVRRLYPEFDRILREHAFGNFRQFVEATSKHPAMLYFLDNYLSTNAGPNENFARELCELHTLGAMNYNTPDGYADEDVYEASRCFTGWTYERDNSSPDRGKFKYVRGNHDRFQKVVLGTAIPRDQGDLEDGLQVLDLLCFHPGTARHIATKLCQRFVSAVPPASIVASTAEVFYDNRNHPNQIRRTLAHIFASAEFREPENRMSLFKRPFDWIVSAMRALQIPYIYREGDNSFDMTGMMTPLGYQLFGWRSPDGPPYELYDWCSANSMLRRCNFVFRIDAGWWSNNGLTYPSLSIMPESLATPRQICEWWQTRIFQRELSAVTFNSLLTFVARGRNPDIGLPPDQIESIVPRLAALCTTSPEFMWR